MTRVNTRLDLESLTKVDEHHSSAAGPAPGPGGGAVPCQLAATEHEVQRWSLTVTLGPCRPCGQGAPSHRTYHAC